MLEQWLMAVDRGNDLEGCFLSLATFCISDCSPAMSGTMSFGRWTGDEDSCQPSVVYNIIASRLEHYEWQGQVTC